MNKKVYALKFLAEHSPFEPNSSVNIETLLKLMRKMFNSRPILDLRISELNKHFYNEK